MLGPGHDVHDRLEKTVVSASTSTCGVDVPGGAARKVGLAGRTKGTAREYFVLWSSMTCSKWAISSSEEGQGSACVIGDEWGIKTKRGHTDRIGMNLLRLVVWYDFTDDANGIARFCDWRWWFRRFGFGLVEARFLRRGTLRNGLCARTYRGSKWRTRCGCGKGRVRMTENAIDHGRTIVDWWCSQR